MKVRNERLYLFLQHFFKKVRVQNGGAPFRYRIVVREGEREVSRIDSGEEYSICCPVCKETRFRLSVNHMFGETIEGIELRHLAHCWNEDCDVVPKLISMYDTFCNELAPEDLTPLAAPEALSGPFDMNEIVKSCKDSLLKLSGVVRVDTLPDDHPAVRYMISRRFDPKVFGPQYAVGYCFNRDYEARFAHKRLIIPLLYKGEYVGWQARAIDGWSKLTIDPRKVDKAWPFKESKYWTSPGTRKSYFLYGYDVAAQHDNVVVMEGPTDAWRARPYGVAAMGRRLSIYQRKLIAETWGERSGRIVLIGDPGFENDWKENKKQLDDEIREPGKVVLILPKDSDVGGMAEDELWRIVSDSCTK